MKKISCIIPAYNEEKGIAQVLNTVLPLVGTQLHEVIVVDDASRDATRSIVRTFPNARLLSHEKNKGKSASVAEGISAATGEYIFLLDADLRHLTQKNIIDLITPVENGVSPIALSYRKNAWPLFPFTKIDYLTGERILPTHALTSSLTAMAALPSYGLEVFLNRIIIREHLAISVVHWPNVENDFNHTKHGWWRGVRTIARIWWNVASTASLTELYIQNIRMQKLLVS